MLIRGTRAYQVFRSALARTAAGLLLVCGAHVHGDENRPWMVAPYLWAPQMKGKVGAGPINVQLDVSPKELAGGINAGAMGYGRWSDGKQFVYLEGIGIQFADREFQPFFNQAVKSELVFAEIGYGRHFHADLCLPKCGALRISPYVGVRRIQMDVAVDSPFLALKVDERWTDPAVGLIVESPLYKRLGYGIKLDAAGFGIDNNRYWSALGGLTYQATDSLALVATWRYSKFIAHPGGGNDLEMRLRGNGPMVGIAWSF